MPNSPIVTGTKPMPARSSIEPKLRRCEPVIVSNPTAARSSPSASIAIDLSGDSAPRPMSVAKESTNTPKSSGGPNARARSAIACAKKVKSSVAMNAPTNDETKDEVSARPGFPFFFASGNPSKRSTTDQGSPGMLKRIDVMTPPKSAPQ